MTTKAELLRQAEACEASARLIKAKARARGEGQDFVDPVDADNHRDLTAAARTLRALAEGDEEQRPCWLVWKRAPDVEQGGRPYLASVVMTARQAERHKSYLERTENASIVIEESQVNHLYGESMTAGFDKTREFLQRKPMTLAEGDDEGIVGELEAMADSDELDVTDCRRLLRRAALRLKATATAPPPEVVAVPSYVTVALNEWIEWVENRGDNPFRANRVRAWLRSSNPAGGEGGERG